MTIIARRAATALFLGLPLALAACGPRDAGGPSFYVDLAERDAEIDTEAAVAMINGYRRNKGLPLLQADAALQRVAHSQARAMAEKGQVDVSLERGNLVRARLDRAGYPAGPAVENVSAGYHTLADAFSGWRGSPRHDANMRHADVTRMGIATAYAPGNKYKVFWSLVLAGPATEGEQTAAEPVPAVKP
ncbi:CAP domain-containing protein [Breoghania sp. L-A4]|uniref:CAP domain-containing protein n=1 Tax=Breoghania sp. L-A4 TaxID=2304600 RepID=UPI000E35C76D|nr:CAP domain-containing protein [Breoghania sp. L-A4]AXS42305.1 CAP domain-containing protein [Breoghania sp. L-A4]